MKAMRVTDATIEQALQATGGFLSLAAQRVGCSVRTISRRVAASAKLQESLNEICDKKLDVAESALMKKVQAGELGAICFYLKCKGKHRGYVERSEVAVQPLAPVDVPETELDRIINECKEGENGKGDSAG